MYRNKKYFDIINHNKNIRAVTGIKNVILKTIRHFLNLVFITCIYLTYLVKIFKYIWTYKKLNLLEIKINQ